MSLDNRTLLFSLVIVYGVMALSMAFVIRAGEKNGLMKWALALSLEAAAWFLISVRWLFPDTLSLLTAIVMLSLAFATKLAAIYEYRTLPCPRAACLSPVIAMAAAFSFLPFSDVKGRLFTSSLIFCVQAMLMVRALWQIELKQSRAWRLLFLSSAAFVLLLALRGAAAAAGIQFATPQTEIAPNPLQLTIFVCVISLGIAGSMGFILLVKERADREIRTLAMTDGLTGLFNRRAFMERAEKALAFAQRSASPLAVMMIDIDHFKSINDRFGHASGDAVLAEIARILSAKFRKQDTIGRYGGEEFCALLPFTDHNGAQAAAEALRKAVEENSMSIGKTEIALTVSIGIACYPECAPESALDPLFESADRALYRAKNAGRNCIMMAASETQLAAESEF